MSRAREARFDRALWRRRAEARYAGRRRGRSSWTPTAKSGTAPVVREGALVAVPDPQSGGRIARFVSCPPDRRLTIIALKSFCAKNLPPYMLPDTFTVVDTLPRTSTLQDRLPGAEAAYLMAEFHPDRWAPPRRKSG